jgi:hypothetical protein
MEHLRSTRLPAGAEPSDDGRKVWVVKRSRMCCEAATRRGRGGSLCRRFKEGRMWTDGGSCSFFLIYFSFFFLLRIQPG